MAIKDVLDLFFPSLCEGCDGLLSAVEKRMCATCLIDLEPEIGDQRQFPFDRLAAVWNYEGAAKRLITRYKEAKRELESPLFANYLLLQLNKLDWPAPEIVVTIPQDPFKRFWMGFDPIGEIGKCLADVLKIPFFNGLKRQGGRPSQASLPKEGRLGLDQTIFFLEKDEIVGKRLLLLDDVMTTGTTLKSAAEVLWKGSPLSIYALALAKVDVD